MKNFYLDFKIMGLIVFGIIEGALWGYLYGLQKKNNAITLIFYMSYFYSLFLQFFSDYIFAGFSTTLQFFIFISVFFVRFKDIKYLRLSKNV